MRVLISVLKAVSTLNQANLIKKLIESRGIEAEYKSTITIEDIYDSENFAFLWFQIATAPFLGDVVVPYLFTHKPKAVYVTIEGIPSKGNFIHSNIPRMEFIANSRFTAKCLDKAGLKVKDVIHHAIDVDLCRVAMSEAKKWRIQLDNQFKDRVKFICVCRHDPRKRLDRLAEAIKILNNKGINDFVVIMLTDISARKKFEGIDNVYFIANFGGLNYGKVLALMSACDYMVFPTQCEGFGLPLLEANAVGTPVIHCWFEPLSEFSSQEFNFVFDYEQEQLVKCGHTQYWIFHDYPAEYLAEMMEMAIDVYRNKNSEYRDYREQALEHAWKWDYRKIYARLLKYLNIG